MSVDKYLKYSELAEAAYVDLTPGLIDKDVLKNNGKGLTEAQAQAFIANYAVIDQYDGRVEESYIDELGFEHTYLKPTGLSVTIFEDGAGNQTVAVRGTDDWYDFITDVIDIAILGSAENQAQYKALSEKVTAWTADGTLRSGFTVTGHSLGGFLAQALAAEFDSDISKIYTYNAPGFNEEEDFSNATRQFLEMFGLFDKTIPNDKIVNLRALQGPSGTAGLGQMIGSVEGITIEDQFPDLTANHSIKHMVDALAVYNLLGTIDANIEKDTITHILNAFPVKDADNLLEAVISSVGKIYGEDYPAIETSLQGQTSRDVLHANISGLSGVVSENSGQATITSLTENSISFLETLTGSMDQLYALLNLNPFYIEGVDYSFLNVDGYLEAENYSEKFIQDRAAFLYHSINEGELSPTSEDIDFKDLSLDVQAYAGNGEIDLPVNAKYIFGSEGADSIAGGSSIVNRADHLYGMGGNDTIQGYGGEDYIEGGAGRDTMNGGAGNDIFAIIGEDEDYDIFNGGADEDTILGSTGDDTIRLHDFRGENTVEIINGGGGEDTIAGTDMADIIDLSGTTLVGIKEIRGCDMTDIIIFSRDDYNLTWRFAA